MPLQGSQGLVQRPGEVSIHFNRLSDKFLWPTLHFGVQCYLCRISVVLGRGFSQLSPSTNALQNIPFKKASSLLKLIAFQCTDFQLILKNVTDVLHFSHLSNFKKTQMDFGGKTSKYICSPHVFVLKFSSGEFLQVNYNLWRKRGFLFGALIQLS